jgi:hypothetical protein
MSRLIILIVLAAPVLLVPNVLVEAEGKNPFNSSSLLNIEYRDRPICV